MRQSISGKKLTRETIVAAAINVNEDSSAVFSLRRVAAAVPCDPMSINHYFGSRDGLEKAMASWIDEQVRRPVAASCWRELLMAIAYEYRRVAHEHPQSFLLLQKFTYTGAADHAHLEAIHAALHNAGIADPDIPTMTLGWFASVIGLITADIGGLIRPFTENQISEIHALSDDDPPHWQGLTDQYRQIDADNVFHQTLDALHEGFSALGVKCNGLH